MKKLTSKEYYSISKDYRGIYSDMWGENPQLKGKRTLLINTSNGTALIFEGLHFEIVEE